MAAYFGPGPDRNLGRERRWRYRDLQLGRAKYGYQLIWVMVLLTVSFAVVPEMCSAPGLRQAVGC